MTLPRSASVLVVGVVLLAGCSDASTVAKPDGGSGIGALPSFLPSPTTSGAAHGTAADPALSYAGSPVIVGLDPGTVTVNVQGPSYPANTKVGAARVSCTFTVVLSQVSRTVNLTNARFDVLDHAGTVHVLRSAAGTKVPAAVRPGQTITLHLVTIVPSGEGLLRYATDGTHTAAAWDYVAETD